MTLCDSCDSPPRKCSLCRHVMDTSGNWLAPMWTSRTTIVATILSGGNREDVLPGAVRSVAGFVDAVLFIHTGPSADKAVEAGLAICRELGIRAHVAHHTGEFDTAKARTFALQEAAKLGYSWSLTVDTDERLELKAGVTSSHLRMELDGVKEQNVILVNIEGGDYAKERLFRLPAIGEWKYRVHEAYCDGKDFAITGSLTFNETPKTAEELDALQRHVMEVCLEEIEAGINPGRHWMYYASALCHFKRHAEAMGAFYNAAQLAEMAEHKSWSYFRAATMCHELATSFRERESHEMVIKAHETAIVFSTIGLRHYPAMPELTWACAFSFWSMAQAQYSAGESYMEHCMSALALTDGCIPIGCQMAPEPFRQLRHFMPIRTFLQAPFTSHEGPWQIRRACLGLLGLVEDMNEANEMVNKALMQRTGKTESEQGAI